jgi:hypothetical protein
MCGMFRRVVPFEKKELEIEMKGERRWRVCLGSEDECSTIGDRTCLSTATTLEQDKLIMVIEMFAQSILVFACSRHIHAVKNH